MNRIDREKITVRVMVALYCRKHHHAAELCDECLHLVAYAHDRLDRCRYGNQKLDCGGCKTHCYRKVEQAQIRAVMRFSGPRMLFYHPIESLKHAFIRLKRV